MSNTTLDPRKFLTIDEYIKSAVDHHKQRNYRNSDRSFALKIGWSASYLNDVCKKRKKATLPKILTLAKNLKLTPLQTEHVIYLCLANTEKKEVGSYFQKYIYANADKEIVSKQSSIDRQFFTNTLNGLVFEILRWARKKMLASEILDLLTMIKHRVTEAEIKQSINYLESNGIVEFDQQGTLIAFQEDHVLDERGSGELERSGVDIHRQYSQNFMDFIDFFQSPSMFNSGFVEIARKDFMSIASKMLDMRNDLIAYSKKANKFSKPSPWQSLVFQFDINLFPMLDKSKEKKV